MDGNLNLSTALQRNCSSYNGGGFDHQRPLHFNPHHRATKSTSDDGEEEEEDEDEPFPTQNAGGSKKPSPWHRVKWTDAMVRLLITAVSYIGEDSAASSSSAGGGLHHQKKGKWKSVSKAMAGRGHSVSPQQCEDKFNDLNKRYKRLNEILGRGTSCQVVENPALLDEMDRVSDKSKEEVRKILSSKHLHYEEMCSYHNGNRLHLPPDLDLQRSLRSALVRSEDGEDHHRNRNHDHDSREEREGIEYERNWSRKREEVERRRVEIEEEMVELERERFKWERFCKKKERELEETKMEIELMRLDNERLALDLRRKELGLDG